MNDFENLVPHWLPLPDVAQQLGASITQVHGLINDRSLIAVRIGDRAIRSVPADFLMEGSVLESLKGTIMVLADAGYSDEEMIIWLFTDDESLPGKPVDALRSGRKTEIRRRAQALAW